MAKSTHTAYLLPGEKIEEDSVGAIKKAERTYQVLESFAASSATAMAATGLPANNAKHPVYPTLRVVSRSPVLEENGIRWLITIVYEPKTASQDTYSLIRVEYGTHGIQEDVLYNRGTGKPLLDANNKPFESTVQETVEYPYIKIVKKQKTSSRDNVLKLSGTINNTQLLVAGVSVPRHGGRIKIVATENPDELWRWEITYEVMVRELKIKNFVDFNQQLIADEFDIGWDIGIINRGYYCYRPDVVGETRWAARALEDILDEDGNIVERRPSATPVPLALDGQVLAAGQTPILIRVQTIKEGNWSPLGLNNL